ncbi:hypothetical protein JCM11491_006812 [Sporobolomyces phaffii]
MLTQPRPRPPTATHFNPENDFLRMDSDSDIIYDSEPDRLARSESSRDPSQATRNHLRRTSDERPGLSSEGSTAELEKTRAMRKQKVASAREVLILDSGSEDGDDLKSAAPTKSKCFPPIASPPKRRRTRSPIIDGKGDPPSPAGWPFSGEVRIGSRSPPLASRRASSRSLSTAISASSPPSNDLAPVASTSKLPPPVLAPKASSPFTSALDLLHSRPTPPPDPFSDSEFPACSSSKSKPRPTKFVASSSSRPNSRSKHAPTSKSTSALSPSQSASSIEIVEAPAQAKNGSEAKGKEKRTEHDDEALSDELISPETWAAQFAHKATKRSTTSIRDDVKASTRAEATPSQDAKRTKPWDAIEAKIGSSTSAKKGRPSATVKKKSKSSLKQEVLKNDDTHSDHDEDPQVLTSGSNSSTALKPCPSGRLSHLASAPSALTKKKPSRPRTKAAEDEAQDSKDSFLFDTPPPLVLPPDDRLKCLSHCPLCAFASSHDRARTSIDSWGTKALSSRQTHLRNCARSHDYSSETTAHLVNQQILVLSVESEDRRLERDLGKSLFDRAIGRGEGTSGRQVTVVGTEGSRALEGEKEWCRDVKDVQEEVDGWRKKAKKGGIEERLARVAKEIRRELEAAAKGLEQGEEGDVVGGNGQVEGPRATGRLKPETESDRDQVAKRARELLDFAHGTQKSRQAVLVLDGDSSNDISGDGQDDFELPPSTQPFEDSTLAKRCHHDGAINILRPLASSPTVGRADKTKSRSPLHEIDLAFSSDEDESSRPRTGSLWKATVGNDEESLSRIVYSRSAPFGSPLPNADPRRDLSSPLVVSPASALNPHLSTLTLSSSASSSDSSLPRPSTLFNYGSSRGLATSARRSPSLSPTRRLSEAQRRRSKSISLDEGTEPDELGDQVEKLGLGGSRRGDGEMEWMDAGGDEWSLLRGGGEGGAVLIGGAVKKNGPAEPDGILGGESSEEEALVDLISRTPTQVGSKSKSKPPRTSATTAKTKSSGRRRISPSSDSGSLSDSDVAQAQSATISKRSTDPPGMPAYSTLPLTTLQKEVQKYGYRPSKEKSVVVQQLKDVWKAINKDIVNKWERGELQEVVAKKPSRGKSKRKEGEAGSEVPKKPTRGRRRKRVAPEESGEEEVEEGETRTVGERLRELIVNERELYLRILRYEPIHIDEFILLAANNNVKIARQLLIRCLDEQCITFYQEDPTNGQRKRHK